MCRRLQPRHDLTEVEVSDADVDEEEPRGSGRKVEQSPEGSGRDLGTGASHQGPVGLSQGDLQTARPGGVAFEAVEPRRDLAQVGPEGPGGARIGRRGALGRVSPESPPGPTGEGAADFDAPM